MLNQRGTFNVIAALLLISFLYYNETLSRASEHIVNNYVSVYYNEPEEPPTSAVKVEGEKLTEEESFNALNNLCSETKWTEGLWLHCHSYCGENKTSACGGLNNARNRIQTCLRLAIDAGAGVIIPSITFRNEEHLADTNSSMSSCADRLFDMEYLQNSLATTCSQLKVRLCDDMRGIKHVIPTRERNYGQASYTNGTFLSFIETAIEIASRNITDISENNSAVVSYGDTLIAWDYRASDELRTIRKELFKVIKFNESLLNLRKEVKERSEELKEKYVGVHFRGEKDWPGGWGSKEVQIQVYTEELLKIKREEGIRSVYVSCGDEEAIAHFRARLTPLGFNVISKTSLLQDPENTALLSSIEKLSFDEKGIVEYGALLDSTVFLGVGMSTMSSLIAYARTVDNEDDFFERWIFGKGEGEGAGGSWKIGIERHYDKVEMRGNKGTRLLAVSGVDVMDSFP